jgi:hypothetical protein
MDIKQHGAEATALRSLAIEHLGAIGAKLCARAMKVSNDAPFVSLPQVFHAACTLPLQGADMLRPGF